MTYKHEISEVTSPYRADSLQPTSPPLPPATVIVPSPKEGNGSIVPTSSPPGKSYNRSTTLVALGAGIGIGGAIVLAVGIFVIWYNRRKRRLGLTGSCEAPPEAPKGDSL